MTPKTIWFSDDNELVTRMHWNPAISTPAAPHGLWESTSVIGQYSQKRLHTSIVGYPKWAKPHMQDMYQTNASWDYASLTQDGYTMGPQPAMNVRMYNVGIPGEAVAMSDSVVTNQLTYDATGKPFAPWAASSEGAAALFAQLEREPIRTSWEPEIDPLDTDFSIWFTIRDIKDFPKLFKGLLKGVRRMSSMLQQMGNLRSILTRRTLKEIASSHLAVQYGWLPTIAGLQEFGNLVMEWYMSELLRHSRFGKTRTYHGPEKVVKFGNVESHKLRFLTAGAGYSYANARVISGPLVSRQTVKYYFVCPELTNLTGKLKLICDRLGLLEPSALWDVIPFSFVVDWFYDVSKLLHSKKPRMLPVTPVIADWGESLSREIQVEINLNYTGSIVLWTPEIVRSNERLCTCWVYQRARRRQFPVPLSTIEKSLIGRGVTLRRAINGSAIVVGRSVRTRNANGGDYRNRS